MIGQASLHIFLVQMLWFGQYFYYFPTLSERWEIQPIPNLIICITGGTLWWWVDTDPGGIRRLLASLFRGRMSLRLRPTRSRAFRRPSR